MLVSQRSWTDRRDGCTWTVKGVWLSDDLVMGPVAFASDSTSYASSCGVTHATDLKLQDLLDHARQVSERIRGRR